MDKRQVASFAALIVAIGLASSCTSTVAGEASGPPAPPPPAPGPPPNDPCSLLSQEEVAGLGLQPGTFQPAQKEQLLPPSCSYKPTDEGNDGDVTVQYSSDLNIREYFMQEPTGEVDSGGLKWQRYPGFLEDSECHYGFELEQLSFVSVTGTNLIDGPKSCELADLVLPYVSSHLPGGAPPPALPDQPPGAPPALTGPLVGVDSCSALKPEQAEELGFSGGGEQFGGGDIPKGCEWQDTDGEKGVKPLDVIAAPDKAATDWLDGDKEGEKVEANGKTWNVLPGMGGAEATCQAILSVTDTSSVQISGGNLDDPAKACDSIKAAIPHVTGNLPAG